MKNLILGASGQLGAHLWQEARRRGHDCTGTRFRTRRPGLIRADLRDGPTIVRLIRRYQPDSIFIATGVSDAMTAETQQELCAILERDIPVHTAQAVRLRYGDESPRPRVVFFSCSPGGSEVLARAKLAAEMGLELIAPDQHLIVRAGRSARIADVVSAAMDLVEGGRVGTCHVSAVEGPLQRLAA